MATTQSRMPLPPLSAEAKEAALAALAASPASKGAQEFAASRLAQVQAVRPLSVPIGASGAGDEQAQDRPIAQPSDAAPTDAQATDEPALPATAALPSDQGGVAMQNVTSPEAQPAPHTEPAVAATPPVAPAWQEQPAPPSPWWERTLAFVDRHPWMVLGWGVMATVFVSWPTLVKLWASLFGLPLADVASRGQFGDQFGPLAALFAGLAAAVAVYAFVMQRRQLREAQQENARVREILSGQVAALEQQQRVLEAQLRTTEGTGVMLQELTGAVVALRSASEAQGEAARAGVRAIDQASDAARESSRRIIDLAEQSSGKIATSLDASRSAIDTASAALSVQQAAAGQAADRMQAMLERLSADADLHQRVLEAQQKAYAAQQRVHEEQHAQVRMGEFGLRLTRFREAIAQFRFDDEDGTTLLGSPAVHAAWARFRQVADASPQLVVDFQANRPWAPRNRAEELRARVPGALDTTGLASLAAQACAHVQWLAKQPHPEDAGLLWPELAATMPPELRWAMLYGFVFGGLQATPEARKALVQHGIVPTIDAGDERSLIEVKLDREAMKVSRSAAPSAS